MNRFKIFIFTSSLAFLVSGVGFSQDNAAVNGNESDKENTSTTSINDKRTVPEVKKETPVIKGAANSTDDTPKETAKDVTTTAKPAEKKVVIKKNPANKNGVNRFNRLLKPPSQRNLPPAKDGIHDPKNDGTLVLQPPLDSFSTLPKANSGNRVDWVKALDDGDIDPRFDRIDPDLKPIILDLNIVREVKGSMPDVVYPHKQHTEWLDCSNCHPAIFIPKKGANNISMASILLGKQCGVCHGKVAFPVSECRKCHSQNKPTAKSKKP